MSSITEEHRTAERWRTTGVVVAAHIDALSRQGSFDTEVRQVLLDACDNVVGTPPKGTTLLETLNAFDDHLDALLPSQVMGVASMGRGSIEVCQTVARMIMRKELAATGEDALALADVLLSMAGAHVVIMLPIWTASQPLQPTTIAGLLGGPVGGLTRGVDALAFAVAQVNQSPMGSGAGASSRFAPDRSELAVALGFEGPIGSVFDAASAVDQFLISASALELVVTAAKGAVDLIDQILITQPDAIIFREEDLARLPDVPQLRRPRSIEAARISARRANRAIEGVRGWVLQAGPGPTIDLDEPLSLFQDATSATLQLLATLAVVFDGGFEFNRAALGNRSAKGHLTASDIVDFLVIEEGISPADARVIAARVLTQLRSNGQEIAAIDRGMIDAAGLLVVGREIGIEFETLSKYLAPRRFLEGRTAEGAPAPSAMREWLVHEAASVQRKRATFAALRDRWQDQSGRSEETGEGSVS